MSQHADNLYDKALRKRCDYQSKGRKDIPQQWSIHAIATHFGKTTDEVIRDIEARSKPREPQPG